MPARGPNPTLLMVALSGDDSLSVGGVDVASELVGSLGRVVLTRDTRVTLHGLGAEGVEALQAVLQKGSWVLVDRSGVPRITCNGANPLTLPVSLDGAAQFTGAAWPDLDPAAIVEVVPVEYEIATFTVHRPATSSGYLIDQGNAWFEAPDAPTSGFECRDEVQKTAAVLRRPSRSRTTPTSPLPRTSLTGRSGERARSPTW